MATIVPTIAGPLPVGLFPPGSLPSLNNTFGALFLAVVGSCILFGVTNLQTYVYFQWYPKDRLFVKASVAVLWCTNFVTICFNVHAVYHYLGSNYGNPLALENVVWSLKWQLMLTAMLIPFIQSLYILRLFKLRGNHRLLPAAMCLLVLSSWAVSLFTVTRLSSFRTFFIGASKETFVLDIDFPLSTSVDILISLSLCFYLRRSSEATFSRENGLIRTIIIWVLSTGLLTSTCSVIVVVTQLTMTRNFVCLAIEIVSVDLYINSYIAMLNARRGLRERAAGRSVHFTGAIEQSNTTPSSGIQFKTYASEDTASVPQQRSLGSLLPDASHEKI